MSEAKADTVQGLGFKDKEKALDTIKNLEGRDPDYQKLAIKGLIGRAKRVLTLTKDKEKLQNINDAMATFDGWLKEFENSNKAKENKPYLPLDTMKLLLPLKEQYKLEEDTKRDAFMEAYKSVKGEYKNLRTVQSGDDEPSWDIVRNAALKKIMKKIDDENPNLWDDDLPTKEHMEVILWSYSPDALRIKKSLSKIEDKLGKDHMEDDKDDEDEDEDEEDEKETDKEEDKNGNNVEEKKAVKRKSEGSSSDSDQESPKKKSKQ
ncbi:PREDICTED: 46 kDa FK506-binding nuclear protein [Nicrophorus vespilloides]|uniref:46 kDa FK506-binding nuclear protein n=1 Tax=Nicrophorus vespilloides TaxID=110193 RepID=A0ABM1MGV3_NICVS|nr:PREDICTED: 46 kDa FK506-binding nuclear protein [Nicrophorus vespilloides]